MAHLIQEALTNIPGVDPRPVHRSQFFSGLNEGPAATASRLAGLVSKSQAQDNSPYYTSNFGQLMPDSGHPLNIGGIPYQGDPLLLEKQQAFDRSKITERIVHPCGWGAFAFAGKSVAETPYHAASSIVSRDSHWSHEGERSEYDQVRELYERVMTDTQRNNLHKNTARLLVFADAIVQKNYLTQQYAISAKYAQSIYDLLPEAKRQGYTMDERWPVRKHIWSVRMSASKPRKGGASWA